MGAACSPGLWHDACRRAGMAEDTIEMDLSPQRIMDGLRWRARALYDRIPLSIRASFLDRLARTRALLGLSNFDHERLTQSYRRAWELLLREDPTAADGDFLEFGVYYGSSLACMHEALAGLGLGRVRILGFDSFAGLPDTADEEASSPWIPGQYRSSLRLTRRYLRKHGVPPGRVSLIKGWFRDTLTPATRREHGIERGSVLMVDCDLYSSAREALAFAAPLIGSRAIIYFDDWHAAGLADKGEGERRAFEEFLAENPDLRARELEGLNYKVKRDVKVFLISRQPAA